MNRKKLTSSTEEDWEAWLVRRWKWLVLGLAVAVLVGIVSLVIVLNAKERDTAAKETIDKLKECLNDTEIHEDMTELVVPSNRCNNNSLDNIDLGRLKKLKTIEIEDNAFQDVINMKLSGLADLERLIIGRNGFLYNHRYKCRELLKRHHYHMIRHTVYYIWLVGTPDGNGSLT